MKNKIYSIEKEFSFDCAHRLSNLNYESPCKNIHGHRYKIIVCIKVNKLNSDGMVIDFNKLKLFQKWLDMELDHKIILSKDDKTLIDILKNNKLNVVEVELKNTTAELFAEMFCDQIYKGNIISEKHLKEIKVKVYETPKNCGVCQILF